MLTRLQISGFKNFVDVDVRFGPFTCIAGPNGVGKSNLFDAIHFLSALAENNLIDAALSIRDDEGKSGDLRSLFHKYGSTFDKQMSFDAEMIIPAEGRDEVGRLAEASNTFLRYTLVIGYREEIDDPLHGSLYIIKESLVPLRKTEAGKNLLFDHDKNEWRPSVIKGRRSAPYISTTEDGSEIKLHLDLGTGGLPQSFPAANSKRTILSLSNTSDSRTAWLARQEMKSWRQLQLEPSALRKPDPIYAPSRLGVDGSHLAATLYRLGHKGNGGAGSHSSVYVQVANRLADLIDDVQELNVDRDQARDLLILKIIQKDGTELDARSLSDGSLRFLALAVLELDPEEGGVICLEEPENGIHPERIPSMLKLIKGIATDVREPIGPDNPLRQVIVNTHSPAIVQQVDDEDLIVAENMEAIRDRVRFRKTIFSCIPDTWRADHGYRHCPKGRLLSYLNPAQREELPKSISKKASPKRMIDRQDFRDLYENSFFAPQNFPK